MRSAVETLQRIAHRRKWTEAQTLRFLKGLAQHPATRGLFRDLELPPPVEGGSANFVQVSGPNGRVQTFNAGASINTFLWNPQSLKGQTAGGDFYYVKRIKFRNVLTLQNNAGSETTLTSPSAEQVAGAFGNVRVYSPFLGELVPKSLNSVPLLFNHDQYFVNGFRPISRRRPQSATHAGTGAPTIPFEFIFEIPFERDYLMRGTDSCPWLPFLEGGTFEVDFGPTTSLLALTGWTVVSCVQTCTIDYYLDKQALIHTPIQSRLYKVTTPGPEYVLKAVGAPNGLEGVISGSRLAALSLLSKGFNTTTNDTSTAVGDNGFYAAFGGAGGPLFGTNGLSRVEVPFRDQIGIDDVNAMLESFLSDCNPIRMFHNENASTAPYSDITQFPFVDSPPAATAINLTQPGGTTQTLICDLLDFWALIWPQPGDKISDFQKVNGDLSLQLNWTTAPGNILNLFRTDEVCGFTPEKVKDLMDRMGMPHADDGGTFDFVPKYAGAKKADDTTVWGFPMKVIKAKK